MEKLDSPEIIDNNNNKYLKTTNLGGGEIISIGLGNFGVKGISAFYNEMEKENHESILEKENCLYYQSKFYHIKKDNSKNARSILFDFNSNYINEIENNKSSIFNKNNLINPNKFTTNRYSIAFDHKLDFDKIAERINTELEKCDYLDGFIINSNICGGIGSGGIFLVTEMIKEVAPNKVIIGNIGFLNPDNPEYSEYQAYNAVLSTKNLIDNLDLVCLYKLEQLASLSKKLNFKDTNSLEAEYYLLGKCFCDFTSNIRFTSYNKQSLNKLSMLLNPYNKLHFCNVSYSFDNDSQQSLIQSFSNDWNLSKLDNHTGRYLSSHCFLRGNYNTFDFNEFTDKKFSEKAVHIIKSINSSPFNYSSCIVSSANNYYSSCFFNNNTANSSIFRRLSAKFDQYFYKRSFVSDYEKSGMEEKEFPEARELIENLIKNYEELCPKK